MRQDGTEGIRGRDGESRDKGVAPPGTGELGEDVAVVPAGAGLRQGSP